MITKVNIVYVTIFALLLVTFLFTRLFKIDEVPSSLYWDEASIGYNAYSILKTGKDEWGETLPLHFRAFGEFKLPVYVYSVAVATKFFGVSIIAVRLPAVLYSLATIIIINLLVTKVLKNRWLGLLSVFFLTTSSWLFLFSRTGYEVTAGIFFYALSFYFFTISLGKSRYFFLSTLMLIVSFYSYNSFRIIAPLSFIIFSIYYLQTIKNKLKSRVFLIIFSMFVFAISMFPFYRLVKQDFGLSRLEAVQEKNISKIFSNYTSHFSYSFLLSKGDSNPRSHVPGVGQIWILDSILIGLGIFVMVKSKNKFNILILTIFLISLIPSAITKEAPHSLRSLTILLPLSLIWIFGLNTILITFKRNAFVIVGLFLLFNLIQFQSYFVSFLTKYNLENSEHWQFQYKEIFTKYKNEINSSKKVIITDKYAQPYIFALNYLTFDPKNFQLNKTFNSVNDWGVSVVSAFDKFEFREATREDLKKENLVFSKSKIGQEDETIKSLNGEIFLYVHINK